MNSLEKIIVKQIKQHGPMDVGQFMTLALSHPEHGYYMKQDPLGRSGDFVTAPEVSQMFGELIGAWAAHNWMRMGAPNEFILLECGPGRGTLMADMMRAVSGVEGFVDAARVHLLEISPALKAKQEQALSDFDPQWLARIEDVPDDLPIIVIANEFFDALPFRSLIYLDGLWFERVIDLNDDRFVFATRPCPKALWPQFGVPRVGDIYEFSSARASFMDSLCQRMKVRGGAGLIVDYGHGKPAFGDTFQAIKGHESVPVTESVGDADLTSHVDFSVLYDGIDKHGMLAQPLIEQGGFLTMLGIEQRAAYLRDKGAVSIEKDLHRLTDQTKMGAIFKVMDFRYDA